ncbi:MAG: phosphate ABC transporter permease subunit PstC [Candidatus Palauibacterales bacterium]|nr:phosphate ABC transporter permease subunit PstC [Candidatus Palauibacterales bacterium]
MSGPGRQGREGVLQLDRPSTRVWRERVVEGLLFLCGVISILTTVGIVVVLVGESVAFFREVPALEFLTGTEWEPLIGNSYGVLPLVNGTMMIAVLSSVVALPVGLATAIYLSEYASDRVRDVVKPALEVLAGIPTVVYGYFALTFITPLLRDVFPGIGVFNAVSASIVVGIMIVPMVSSLSEDAISAVPRSLRQAAYGVGATKFEVSTRVVVPAAFSGVVSSFILAVSRAIGETVAVYLAAGVTARVTADPTQSIQTITSYIVQASLGDASHGTTAYQSIFAVGLLLFVITLGINLLSDVVRQRFREVYE